ncbi:hypothetical protein V5O48_016315 [Marasmius crinis-equi]|uniref:Uncharacterized protein n=1 Tax=Marasmius crinis-equi TaxID=585013 RepID=A0ABR3ES19_9AGAR
MKFNTAFFTAALAIFVVGANAACSGTPPREEACIGKAAGDKCPFCWTSSQIDLQGTCKDVGGGKLDCLMG